MQRVAVLGATGSIGASALDVIARHPDRLRAEVLAAGSRVDALVELCRIHAPRHAVIADPAQYAALRDGLAGAGLATLPHAGNDALDALVAGDACDTVVAAIVGASGLPSTLAAARAGKRLLLANKESLVLAGELLVRAAQAGGATVVPIDSEHNAIHQCLAGCDDRAALARITLTASGGPFRGHDRAALAGVTPAQAVAHPKWSMGPKISVDSATLMNKGLEVIEAHHLFGLPGERIGVLVHPQSLVHSLVDFIDGSTLAQLGLPDMRTALAVGFGWPGRLASGVSPLDLLEQGGRLDFERPDLDAFPCLDLAYRAMEAGGTAPAVLNAANEEAVSAFLQGRIGFLCIPDTVAATLDALPAQPAESIGALLEADAQARALARARIASLASARTRTPRMSTFLGSLWWLLVALGVLVTFHEFGHFWVARRCGVKVLRFSVGFGRTLWSRRGKDGTEYVVAALPLGGYVKMLDEREGEVAPADLPHAFNRQSVWTRIAIVSAGPLANVLLAIGLLWAMLVIGRPDYAPVVGKAEGLAAQAGLQAGDAIRAVDGRATPTWSEAAMALSVAALDREPVALRVQRADGSEQTRSMAFQHMPAAFDESRALEAAGLTPRHFLLPPVVGTVSQGLPAWGVLAEGDRITAIDASPVASFDQIAPLVQALGERGGSGMVEVERDGERLALELAPVARNNPDGTRSWLLGVGNATRQAPAHDALLRYNPLAALPAAVAQAWRLGADSIGMLWKMLNGSASVQNVSGPITIAQYANVSAQMGLAWFLNFLALLSVSLAIINLLPIPVLDGGHLLYYLIELVVGRPLGERAMAAGQYLGLAFIAGLMGLAFYNDILRLVS